jgi:DNA-binding transcriptional ArsR family regulator
MDLEEDTYNSIFTALKHPVRRRILRMLGEGSVTYTGILRGLEVETGFLNYHLESLRGLVTKDSENRYCLSEFGRAALDLMDGVEKPSRRQRDTVEAFGHKLPRAHLFLVIIALLVSSTGYLLYANLGLTRGRDNALGATFINTRWLLGGSLNIIDNVIEEEMLELDPVYRVRKYLFLFNRNTRVIKSLDPRHKEQWSEIQEVMDCLSDFFNDLDDNMTEGGRDDDSASLALQGSQLTAFETIRDDLAEMIQNAFPDEIRIGAHPRVRVIDSEIMAAIEVAMQLEKDIMTARTAFDLNVRFR